MAAEFTQQSPGLGLGAAVTSLRLLPAVPSPKAHSGHGGLSSCTARESTGLFTGPLEVAPGAGSQCKCSTLRF